MSVIRVITRISPANMMPNGFSKLVSPSDLGVPCKVQTCCVTDPKSGLQYVMETTFCIEKVNSSEQSIEEQVAAGCEKIPGLVCVTDSDFALKQGNGTGYTLSIPKCLPKDEVSHLLGNDEARRVQKKGKKNDFPFAVPASVPMNKVPHSLSTSIPNNEVPRLLGNDDSRTVPKKGRGKECTLSDPAYLPMDTVLHPQHVINTNKLGRKRAGGNRNVLLMPASFHMNTGQTSVLHGDSKSSGKGDNRKKYSRPVPKVLTKDDFLHLHTGDNDKTPLHLHSGYNAITPKNNQDNRKVEDFLVCENLVRDKVLPFLSVASVPENLPNNETPQLKYNIENSGKEGEKSNVLSMSEGLYKDEFSHLLSLDNNSQEAGNEHVKEKECIISVCESLLKNEILPFISDVCDDINNKKKEIVRERLSEDELSYLQGIVNNQIVENGQDDELCTRSVCESLLKDEILPLICGDNVHLPNEELLHMQSINNNDSKVCESLFKEKILPLICSDSFNLPKGKLCHVQNIDNNDMAENVQDSEVCESLLREKVLPLVCSDNILLPKHQLFHVQSINNDKAENEQDIKVCESLLMGKILPLICSDNIHLPVEREKTVEKSILSSGGSPQKDKISHFVCNSDCKAKENNKEKGYVLSMPESESKEKSSHLLKVGVKKVDPTCVANPSFKLNLDLIKSGESGKESKCVTPLNKRERLLEPLLKYFVANECLICGLAMPNASKLKSRKHMLSHIKHNSYVCNCCDGKLFSSAKSLYSHMLKQIDKKPHAFDVCNNTYNKKHLLNVHKQKEHNQYEQSFESVDERIPFKQKIPTCFACTVCKKRFESWKLVVSHKSVHSGNESYMCLFCCRSFSNTCLLRYHSHIRIITQFHKCKLCGKRFTSQHNLREHKSLHHKKVLYKCKLCGKKFNFRSNLVEHWKMLHANN